jgi:hypothetical protein
VVYPSYPLSDAGKCATVMTAAGDVSKTSRAARGPTINYCTENETTSFVAMSMSAKSLCAQRRRVDLRSVLPETILPVAAN